MPRPKHNPDEVLTLELRITPPDGKPIEDWKIQAEDFRQVIAAEEGGDDDCRLHYHLYIETLRSRSWITKWVYSIAHCHNGETGNSVFFSRKPHDNTIGYVVKSGNVVVRHGCSQTFIDEWLLKSEQYRKDKDSARAKSKRLKKSFTQAVLQNIVERVRDAPELRTPEQVLQLILAEYHEAKMIFPSRTTVENLIITVLYPYNQGITSAFYLRSFETRY